MNKRAESFAFGISFLAVLASFMLIVAPVLVAAPMYFPPFAPIEPPSTILFDFLKCADYDGVCKAACAGDEQAIGENENNLNCAGKCCKKKNTCPSGDSPFSKPCLTSKDCTDGICIVIGKDPTRCCSEEQVTICINPGTPGQHTQILPAHKFREFVKNGGKYNFGACPEVTPTSTPTINPTGTPVPTSTPTTAPTSTPVPTGTPLPTETPTTEPTQTQTPTSVPTSVPTQTPTQTPTGTPMSSPSPTGTP